MYRVSLCTLETTIRRLPDRGDAGEPERRLVPEAAVDIICIVPEIYGFAFCTFMTPDPVWRQDGTDHDNRLPADSPNTIIACRY